MIHIVATGTDVASVAIFDPLALPAEFDQSEKDQGDILRRLHDEGRVFLTETGGDGAYLVHALVDEPVPGHLKPYLQDPIVLGRFDAPSGRIYAAGAEYAFHKDDRRIEKYPHMGGSFAVKPGRYRLSVYRTEYPERMLEGELRQLVKPSAFRLHQSMGCLVALAVVGLVVLLASYFALPTRNWAMIALPVSIGIVATPVVVARLPVYQKTQVTWDEVQSKFPSLVAEFRALA